jgi:hypothetical protein
MSKHQRIEHKDLLSVLSNLNFIEMMNLYIEAKTGDERNIDQLPVYYIEKIEELQEELNQLLGDKVIKDLFK